MKKIMKKLALALAGVMTVGLLGGCGNTFDASAYTKALLDNSYKNDSTGFVQQNLGTAEEAAALYEEGLDAELEAMLSMAGITEEQAESFREVWADLLAGVKYTVGEAEKQDDGSFVVNITYEQMKVFEPTMTEYMDVVTKMAEDWAATGEFPSDEEMMDEIVLALKDCLVNAMANVTYAEPATTTIRIEIKDKQYQPNEDDILKLEEALFDIDAMTNF